MLGWEYPPRFAGGLGKACQGLSQAMAKLGAQVFFVLPTFPEKVVERHLEVVGAWECLMEAGWDPDRPIFISEGASGRHLSLVGPPVDSEVITIRSSAQLFPYGAHPEESI